MAEELEDAIDALNLALCRARIAVQQTILNSSPHADRQLADLQVERIELEIRQLECRTSLIADQVDLTLDALELELCDKRIIKATSEANNAPQAEQNAAELEIGYVILQIEQHKKRTRRAASSTTSGLLPVFEPSSASSVPPTAPLEAAAVFCASPPSVEAMHRASLPVSVPSDVIAPDTTPALDIPAELEPSASPAQPAVASPQHEGVGSPAPLHDDDAMDAGDIERQLTRDADFDPVKVKQEPQLRGPAGPARGQYIEIDEHGARDITPHPTASESTTRANASGGTDGTDDEHDALASDDDESFPIGGSPRAPKSVLVAKTSRPTSPSKPGTVAASALISRKPASAAHVKKTGGRKEPRTAPERWASRLQGFGAAILQQSSGWSDGICRLVRILWVAVLVWEAQNGMEDGSRKLPASPANLGGVLSKARFGPNFVDIPKIASNFPQRVAACFEAVRNAAFADVVRMHGPHGLAVLARALVEARNASADFEQHFAPLALELTTLLELVTAALPARLHDGVSQGASADAVAVAGTVLEALHARTGYDPQLATDALDALQHRRICKDGKGKKRDASHLQGRQASPKQLKKSD